MDAGHSIDRFFAGRDAIEWIAVRAECGRVASAWAQLADAEAHPPKVAGNVPEHDPRAGAQWLVGQVEGSSWTHVHLARGAGAFTDRPLRELSSRVGFLLLCYGRNDVDKARALACVAYEAGTPQRALLLGDDDDQDLILDHLLLDPDEIADLDFELDFDQGRDRAAAFLVEHGLEVDDFRGAPSRLDLVVAST